MAEFTEARTTLLVQDRAISVFDGFYDSLGDKLPCEYCGVWGYLERHHRKFRSRGGDWRPSNIMLLCGHCHHLTTVASSCWARQEGLWVSQWSQAEIVPVRTWYAGMVLFDNEGGYTKVDNAVRP